MWSLGCILGEMIRGKPIFPGSSTVNQIERIVTALPRMKEKEIKSLGAGFGSALLNQQAIGAHATMEDLLYGSPDDAKHLVKSLLVLDPTKRLTATEALNHVYIEKFRNSQQEYKLSCDVLPPFRDDVQLSVPEYRSKLYELVQSTSTSNTSPPYSLNLERRSSLSNRKSSTSCGTTKSIKSDGKPTVEPKYATPTYSSNLRKVTTPQQQPLEEKPLSRSCSTNVSKQIIVKLEKSQSKKSCSSVSQKSGSEDKFPYINSSLKSGSDKKFNSLLHEKPEKKLNGVLSEKRHSIDCSYSFQAPNKTSESRTKNLEFTQHSLTKEPRAQTTNCSYQSEIQKPRKYKITKNDIVNMTTDGSSYYEQRLKTLEEKIQKHRQDIKAFCGENSKLRSKSVHHPVANDLTTSTSNNKSIRTKSSAFLQQKSKDIHPSQATTSFLNIKVVKASLPQNTCKYSNSDHHHYHSHHNGNCEMKRSQMHFPVRTNGLLKQTS